MGKYALEVEKEFANLFSVPGATIVESQPIEESDTVVFIVESKRDLRLCSRTINLPGVCSIEPL